jgi:aminoglycoside phosphotransferase (APT) family kinase protein
MDRVLGKDRLGAYLARFGVEKVVSLKPLGRGVHGQGWLLSVMTASGPAQYVIKSIRPGGLGHDYPSDRAALFLLALDSYNRLPGHIRAMDVLSVSADGSVRGIGGGREYYLLMEKAEGTSYFADLKSMAARNSLNRTDKKKIAMMTDYLAEIHSVRNTDAAASRHLYRRKIRDTIGHGECLMGVFDTYPAKTLSAPRMAEIEKKCIDWRVRLRNRHRRLRQIHGDFHPGNIWFRGKGPNLDFILLDRSRGPWGDPADDLTALCINYIFFSVMKRGVVKGACLDALRLFCRQYVEKTGDKEILEVSAPFFAFRGAVVANPVFYPELSAEGREKIFGFVKGVLDDRAFSPERVNDYMG